MQRRIDFGVNPRGELQYSDEQMAYGNVESNTNPWIRESLHYADTDGNQKECCMTPDSETIQIQTSNYNITRQRHALVLLITRALLIPEGFITLRIHQLLSDAAPLEPVHEVLSLLN